MERRQKKTRNAIYAALTSLLETKNYSSITVKDIIDKADVGRSTFYTHFETKDDLLKSLCTEIFEHVFSDPLKRESTHDFSAGKRDLKEELTHILYHLQGKESPVRRLLSSESGEIFMNVFKKHLEKVFHGELEKPKGNVPESYLLDFTVNGFAETVRWWMRHGEYPPEEVSGFFLDSMPFLRGT